MSEPKTTTANPQRLAQKLLSIQKSIKTFAVSEESGKVNPTTNKPAYSYTPGWQIIEDVREKMDQLNIMLLPDFKLQEVKEMEFPVFRLINGKVEKFVKKDALAVIQGTFTWLDAETGETLGPFGMPAGNMNGIDKSVSSAISFAERYFLKEFFHFTTREQDDEPDATNTDFLPGIGREYQGAPASPVAASGQQGHGTPTPAGGYLRQPAPYASAPAYTPAPAPAQSIPMGADENNPIVAGVISKLMNFEKGSPTHQKILNQAIGEMTANGINSTNPNFLGWLVETAQARRENRQPIYQ